MSIEYKESSAKMCDARHPSVVVSQAITNHALGCVRGFRQSGEQAKNLAIVLNRSA
jgi:hypothetical protein